MLHYPIAFLARFSLFQRREPAKTPWEIICWWELRRIPYNVIVAAAGILCIAIMFSTAMICESALGVPIGMPDPIFAMVTLIAYPVMANICYTGGWIAEILSLRVWGQRAEAFGEISFTLGTLFSIALTLTPAGLVVTAALFQAFTA